MEKKSLITWKDAIKLAFGIAVGLLITTFVSTVLQHAVIIGQETKVQE